MQLIISSIILTPLLYGAAALSLPETFKIGSLTALYFLYQSSLLRQERLQRHRKTTSPRLHLYRLRTLGRPRDRVLHRVHDQSLLRASERGRWVSSFDNLSFNYFLIKRSCKTGAATNVIFGLALGYKSTIVPVIAIRVCDYISFKLLGRITILYYYLSNIFKELSESPLPLLECFPT